MNETGLTCGMLLFDVAILASSIDFKKSISDSEFYQLKILSRISGMCL